MSEEILINVTPRETRVAVVENGVLQEVFIERANKRGNVGNIYKGVVKRVLPGMHAAFVDLGLERTGFLHASDIVATPGGEGVENGVAAASIASLLREGQEILVQVVKDPMGSKGARLTTHLSVASRYLVYMPSSTNVGISARIENEEERQRLRDLANAAAGTGEGGYIIRTAAEGVSEQDLRLDVEFLRKLWDSVRQRAEEEPVGRVIYEDLSVALRTMRDMVGSDVEKVRVDSREAYQRIVSFAQQFIPEIVPRIEYYPGERPIFDLYGIEYEIQRALERKVQLKSGGHLVIDQTEAMTTVDVNTGAFVGHRNLEETIFKTNLEAAQAIARQLRLRNLGGIIIIDFIDMAEEAHRRNVMRALEKALMKDRAKTFISAVSNLGLVEMTRKRTRESLEHVLCEFCPTCTGRGSIKSPETVCYEIFRDIIREARQFESQQLLVLASQQVVDVLLDQEATSLAELEAFVGRPVKLQVESLYGQEQFDVVLI